MKPPSAVSIRTKLSVAFGTALAFIVAVGLLSLVQLRTVKSVTEELRFVWLPRIETLVEIKRTIAEHRFLATIRTQTTNVHRLATIAQSMDEALKVLRVAEQSYAHLTVSAEEKQLFLDFATLWNNYRQAFRRVDERLESGNISLAVEEFNSMTLAAFDRAAEKLDELITRSRIQRGITATRIHEVYEVALLFTAAVIALASILTGIAIAWTSRSISAPILRASTAMRRLAAGDYSVAMLDDRVRRDEIGVLLDTVNSYRDNLIFSRSLTYIAERNRERLQAAVSNMPVGLCMFDAEQHLIICNGRYAEIYQLPRELTKPGTKLREILGYTIRDVNCVESTIEEYLEECLQATHRRSLSSNLHELNNGRIVNVIHQPMKGGGWVATHEDVTEKCKAEARIHHMARHDGLTNLPNRAYFKERLEEALIRMPSGEKLAVLCVDLDEFKNVNDTLGHSIGDALLQIVADRLRASVRQADTIARFGGDEFVIVQVDLEQPASAKALAKRIIEALSAPFDVGGHQIIIGASIGVAVAPSDGDHADNLLKNADIALYRAKNDGRATCRFFEIEMDDRLQVRRALEIDLRRALLQDEFELYYQPIVDLRSNQISTLEALIRWRHPRRGMILPSEFIPLAEDIGLIVPIGVWALRQACLDAMTWQKDVRVAVNLSPIQFRNEQLLECMIKALAISRLPANRLELEITERVLLKEHEATLAVLHRLRAFGIRVALDDFGTGYSSVSYLRSFPFDKIKIDRSFISNLSTDESSLALVRAVMVLGSSLAMEITAEGVETEDQLARVRAEGCTHAQGLLFGEARPAHEVLTTLAKKVLRTAVAA